MRQYTLVVWSDKAIAIPDPLIMLGPGTNTFSVFTGDISDVVALLEDEGADVKSAVPISAASADISDMLLPGEDLSDVLSGPEEDD